MNWKESGLLQLPTKAPTHLRQDSCLLSRIIHEAPAGNKTGMLTAETRELIMEMFLDARKIEGFTLDVIAERKVALQTTSPLFLSH